MAKTVLMVPQVHQWWQAKAPTATDTSAAALTAGQDDAGLDFSKVFGALSKEGPAASVDANNTGNNKGLATSDGEAGDGEEEDGGEDDGDGGELPPGGEVDGEADDGEAEGEEGEEGETAEAKAAREAAEARARQAPVDADGKPPAWMTPEFLATLRGEDPSKKDQQQQKPIGPEYTEEEAATLKEYEKEWSDVSRCEELKRREEYKVRDQFLIGHIFNTMVRPLMETVRVLQGGAVEQQAQTAYTVLKQRIPDYDDVVPKVSAWVNTLPAGVKEGYQNIVKQGSVDQVVHMVESYKAMTGQKTPPKKEGGKEGAENQQQGDGGKPAKVPPKRVVDNLRAPGGKRTVTPQDENVEDFSGAFGKFAAEKEDA